MSGTITITPLTGIPEVSEGDDLADVIQLGLDHAGVSLAHGDVLVVSSKIASKALGLVTHDPDKDRVVRAETEYVVAERAVGDRVTRIVRAKAGPIMAAAGVDGSNTGARGGWLLLPHDPDAVCERLHDRLLERHGVRVGVVLSDTAGRPWRVGQVDFALGAHGLSVLDDLRGGADADGKPLEVTTRAVADEIAAAADLAKGKVAAVPAALLRGLPDVLVAEPLESHPRGLDPAVAEPVARARARRTRGRAGQRRRLGRRHRAGRRRHEARRRRAGRPGGAARRALGHGRRGSARGHAGRRHGIRPREARVAAVHGPVVRMARRLARHPLGRRAVGRRARLGGPPRLSHR